MPRQDVPYGGAICRLKERIAEIWDKLGEKLHSINGVEGDGAGNVNIVSGDAAITVSESPTGHFIEIGLDHGNLPSATVSSVNGQTGAVRLDAADIPSDGNSNVQADIAANKTAINDCIDSITSEQVARQSADSTLQTNINTVQASIPEMSTAPDPYKGVERDAQGRAFAADPAAGATDKTLVTANWVSQTGDRAPNNLIHKTGIENRPSGLLLTCYIGAKMPNIKTPSSDNVWIRWCEVATYYNENNIIEMISNATNNGLFYCMFAVAGAGGYSRCASIVNVGQISNSFKIAVLLNTVTNFHEIWIYVGNVLRTDLIISGLKYGYMPRIREINEEYTDIPTDGYSNKVFVLGSE